MRSIIIGTAGHIDHGKTALVRALTGVDADRLPEEKRRGITIDLGFADLDLGDVRAGFVDVPGHERFVKNMLAGAHGIDLVALVIAADEGVMPQTREHFEICRLLGVAQGLVVITKKDLVDEELLALVETEARDLVQESFLAASPMVAVSARTGEGIDDLKHMLRQMALNIPARPADFITRLPIDRAFTMKGFGAVVTGTLIAGEISEGSELELLPSGSRVRVRGLQVHGAAVPRATAGQRTAVNLGGVDTAAIERGMVLAPVASLHPTQIIDARIEVLKSSPRALRSRARVRVHLGAAEVLARVRVLETGGEIPPGETGMAQLRFELPVVAVRGDRFVVRSYSPSRTIAGGTVLDPFAAKHRGRDTAEARARLAELHGSDKAGQVGVFIQLAGANGLRRSDLIARTGWHDEVIDTALAETRASGLVVDAEGVFVTQEAFAQLKDLAQAAVAEHHRREPLSKGLSRETLRERHFAHAAPELFRFVIADLEKAGELVSEKDTIRARAHSRELSTPDAQLRDRFAQIYEAAGLAAPTLDQAMAETGTAAGARAHARKIFQLLIDGGLLVQVQPQLFFHRPALDELTVKLRAYAEQHQPERAIDVASFKELAGISRKYAIPLLEFFDREHVTRRDGDRRVIL
ncbi:MAG: selenocysteine-specific elongation factor [Blastocatellia bacterium]|jgi:selenocysteine-specific elongation factor|nr:selenocysteine-specific elongation factor [Blastocatellia bacterium]